MVSNFYEGLLIESALTNGYLKSNCTLQISVQVSEFPKVLTFFLNELQLGNFFENNWRGFIFAVSSLQQQA